MTTQSKITLWSILIAIFMIMVTGWAAQRILASTVLETSIERLTLIRDVKVDQVENYFSSRTQSLEQLGRDTRIISAVQDFSDALTKISRGEDVLPENMSSILRQNYDRKVLPGLKQRLDTADGNVDAFWPKRKTAQYLHYQYVIPAATPPLFQTNYDIAHLAHHDGLKTLADNIGARDLLLIDAASGDIIYTVAKTPDLGMNILKGPYRKEVMADLFDYVKTGAGQLGVSDLVAYLPDDNVNSLFIGAPILNEDAVIGVLMIRLSSAELTEIMTGDMDWKGVGLGETGDLYLAGEDYFMRSNSRFAHQDIGTYVDNLRARGVQASMVRQIDRQGSTVLAQEVRTDDVAAALQGETGVMRTRDYRGAKVISAYAPLDIPNLKWGLIAKQDSVEILKAHDAKIWRAAIFVLSFLIVVWILSRWFAIHFVRIGAKRDSTENSDHLLKSTSRE